MAYLFDRRRMTPQPRAAVAGDVSGAPRHRVRFSYLSQSGHVVEESHAIPWLPAYRGICATFARGTLVSAPDGPVAVEDLLPGDPVMTRDSGAQPLRWIGCTTLRLRGAGEGADTGGALRIPGESLGPGRPSPDLILHESARILMPQETFAERRGPEGVLVALSSLVDDVSVIRLRPVSPLEFFNIAFDRHQIICANGICTESFHPGRLLRDGRSDTRQLLDRLFPYLGGRLDGFGQPSRHHRDHGMSEDGISAA